MKRLEAIVERETKGKTFSWDKIIFQLLKLEMENKVVNPVSAKKFIVKKAVKVKESKIEEETNSKKSRSNENHFLTELYHLEQRAFYEQTQADYETMYAHMGQAKVYVGVAETVALPGRNGSVVGDYERKGELTSQEAMSIVEKVTLAKMTGDFSRISFVERERFCNWRMFNKSMRRMFESAAGYGGKNGAVMALV